MDYWHIQMLFPWGRGEERIDSIKMLQENKPIIGTGEWDDMQCRSFKGENGGLQIGDVIMVREGNKPLALCEIVSDYFEDNDLEEKYLHKWYRYVKVLDWAGTRPNSLLSQGTLGKLYADRNTPSWNYINNWYQEIKKMELIQQINGLLLSCKNLILTGAPGTGKTFLAKQIAEAMNAEVGFVQFHPSYDYTDFVEGLRPVSDHNGHIGFERKDGVFKEFCKRALEYKDFSSQYNKMLKDLNSNNIKETLCKEYKDNISEIIEFKVNPEKNIISYKTNTGLRIINEDVIEQYIKGIENFDEVYPLKIGKFFKENYYDKNFVFIIDEINRGEISKIFGELFFSIDPGYRDEKGKVQTQYTNLIEDEDIFKDGFFIPENVYIIGTMNDIDRSVASFDFAMRRRFAWVEITAEESAANMGLSDDCKNKMQSLNAVISGIEGLNASYHIGGAYFLDKEDKKRTDYDDIWKLRLHPLLKEYLRGMPDAESKLEELKKAYENNGQ